MKNKKNGTEFEHRVAELLYKSGFWSHVLEDTKDGQPFDIIAVRKGKAAAIDAKECQTDKFDLNRIENNQVYAMSFWQDCRNGDGWFALGWKDGSITMLTLTQLITWRVTAKHIKKHEAKEIGVDFFKWTEKF